MRTAFRRTAAGIVRSRAAVGVEVIAAIAIPILLIALFAVGGNMIQHRLVWSTESLKPKLSKISPGAGLKRLFSKVALVNFVKGIAQDRAARHGDDDAAVAGARPARTLVTLDVAAILPLHLGRSR